ncbi:glycosyltransferase family 4 protein [bacterium]|nr:glycosyltransferase family 4 protein [bacterium]
MTDPRPIRVCSPQMSLSPENTYGGGIFHLKLLEALAERGTPCVIPLAFRSQYEPRPNWDVLVIPVERTYKLGPIISNAVFFLALTWLWFGARRRFDIVRVTDPYYVGPAALAFRALTGVPLAANVFHLEDNEHIRNFVVRHVCRRCNGVIVTSEFSKAQASSRLGLDPEKIYVTYGGTTELHAAPRTPEDARRAVGLSGKRVFGFVGALSERKNPGYLLEVFAPLARTNADLHLVIVGDDAPGEEGCRERLMRRATTLGVESRVTFTGRIANDRKALYARAMDLFVFPSLLEGFGLAVVELMALGVPAVVSNRGSLPEVVKHDVTGLVLPLEDRDRFGAELASLLADDARLARYGDNARRAVRERFTWERCAEETDAIHDRLTRKRRRRILAVVLNAGDGAETMRREGQLARFNDNYVAAWSRAFDRVDVYEYGASGETPFPNAHFVAGRPRWRGVAYGLALPFLHRRRIRRASLVRAMHAGAALPAVIAQMLWRRPLVVTYGYRYDAFMREKRRPLYARYAAFVARRAIKRAHAVIVTNASLEAHVRALIGPERVHLIPNGVDTEAFAPNGAIRRDGKATVVFVGRLEPQKNPLLLAAALAPMRERVRLVVAGDGALRSRLADACAGAGIEADLRGTVPHTELPALLASADVFVLPSRIEGHPKSLLEAMAAGLPCVGTRVAGIEDVLRDGETGLLVPPDDAAALCDAIERVLDDKELARTLGAAARKDVETRYDLRANIEREIALLNAVAMGVS